MKLGVNLAGADFGGGHLPGTLGTDYTYPTSLEIDYYAGKGMSIVRLPFLWERVQLTANGPLSTSELAQMDGVVAYAASRGLQVILEPHNFGSGYGHPVGSAETPDSAFADLWSRLAGHFAGSSNVIFGLMNEPHQQTAQQWLGSANAAIAAIRAGGAGQQILVPGSYWTGAHSWVSTDNDTVIGPGIRDPLGNFAFEVHQYLDSDSSGTHANVVSANIGVERLTAVTQWAEATGSRLFLGEFGVAQDPVSLAALANMVAYMKAHPVWEGATYWAAGPWWGDYMFSIEPTGLGTGSVVDRPQMDVLEAFLGAVFGEIRTGGTGGDLLYGGAGNDSLKGGDGTDILYGEAGDDLVEGGAGDDTQYGGDGNDILGGQGGNDLLQGGAGNDRLYGDEGDDVLGGQSGDDYLDGQTGNDRLWGDEGDDTLLGGDGDDVLEGGLDNDLLRGEAGADTLLGDAGNDVLEGGLGNDLLYGGAGNDSLKGGDGTDILYGEAGDDLVEGGAGDDTQYGGDGNDILGGQGGNDLLQGGAGNDRLWGDEGDDIVFGGDGNDALEGGTGNDLLRGEAGADTFVFGLGQGQDTVSDFSFASGDRLWLQGQGYTVSQVAGGTLVTLSDGSVLLQGISASSFQASWVV